MPYLTFAAQSVGDAFRAHSSERLLNWYAEPGPQGAASPMQMAPCPGLARFADIGVGEVFSLHDLNGTLYAAAGGRLWSVETSGRVRELATVPATSDAVIVTQGRDVVCAAGGFYRAFRPGTGVLTVSDGPFASVAGVCAVNGRIVAAERNGTRVKWSALDDAGTFGELDFFSAESAPGRIVGIIEDHQEVWVFGQYAAEVWVNSGGDLVFERVPGGVLQRGCRWGATIRAEDNGVFWVGDDGIVYRAQGYQPVRVSTAAVERALRRYVPEDPVTALTYTWEGHKFYVLRFPDAPAWCLDLATGLWHERNTGAGEGAWAATSAAPWNAPCTCGQAVGTAGGRVCFLGGETDDGSEVVREAVSTPLTMGGRDFTLAELRLLVRTGEVALEGEAETADLLAWGDELLAWGDEILAWGEDATAERDATAMVQVSRDGGRTYGVERWRSLGRIGRDPKVAWHALGRSDHMTVKLRVSDPIGARVSGVSVRLVP